MPTANFVRISRVTTDPHFFAHVGRDVTGTPRQSPRPEIKHRRSEMLRARPRRRKSRALQTQDSEIPDIAYPLPAPSAPCKPRIPNNSRFHFRPPALLANPGFRNSRFHFRPPALNCKLAIPIPQLLYLVYMYLGSDSKFPSYCNVTQPDVSMCFMLHFDEGIRYKY